MQGSQRQGTLTSMPEQDQAAQLQCIWRASVGQTWKLVHQLTITVWPVEDVAHYLHGMEVTVLKQQVLRLL